jgi:hypothetical protein
MEETLYLGIFLDLEGHTTTLTGVCMALLYTSLEERLISLLVKTKKDFITNQDKKKTNIMKAITNILTNYIGKRNNAKMREKIIREVIAEIESQKALLTAVKQDDLDDVYEQGVSMALYVVKEMINKNVDVNE